MQIHLYVNYGNRIVCLKHEEESENIKDIDYKMEQVDFLFLELSLDLVLTWLLAWLLPLLLTLSLFSSVIITTLG